MPDVFNYQNFMPHGFCMRWDPALLTTMLAANIGIAVAYFAIPAALWYFVRHRKDLPYAWMFRMFMMFIIACGLTHIMKIWTIYNANYWLEALVDLYTAFVSLTTACLLWPLIPKALALRSPSSLQRVNEQLEEANQKLTKLNEELATANQNLELARDQALESAKFKSSFVANISHELRTPLNGVLGMNELLLGTELNEHQRDLSTTVQEQARCLLTIVNDILDLSKIESGKMKIESARMNPCHLVHECVQALSSAAKQKGLQLSTQLDARIPKIVRGDPLRIHQVLLNLLGNAVKFTKEGSVVVSAMLVSQEADKVCIKFQITDTGIGMSPDEQKYLFLPFMQVDGSTTRKFGGTGLGLSLSKKLVELMGGDVGVTSSKGEGSTFWFSVPLTVPSEDSLNRTTNEMLIPTIAGASGKTVLIVEDHPALKLLAVKQLRNLGITCHAVGTGKEALAELDKSAYDMVLLDCNLPDISGYEVTRLIREHEGTSGKHVNIVAMTAGAMTGDLDRCLEAGMDDYLAKPYTLDELRQKLERWITTTTL